MSKYAPRTLFYDNQDAISLTKNPTYHAKTTHADVQLHFIQDHVEKGTINVEYCPTENMLADLMTKGLAWGRHKLLLGFMGLVPNTTPSRVEDIGNGPTGRHSTEIRGGSEELRNSHADLATWQGREEPASEHLIFAIPIAI